MGKIYMGGRCCHSSMVSSVTSIYCPGFESQAHHLCTYQLIFELCHVEMTQISKKEAGIGPFKKVYMGGWSAL